MNSACAACASAPLELSPYSSPGPCASAAAATCAGPAWACMAQAAAAYSTPIAASAV